MKLLKNLHNLIMNSAFGEIEINKKNYSTNCKSNNGTKLNLLLLISIILFCSITMVVIKEKALHNTNLQEGIANEIIRFHVIANSDSDEDQSLKLKVRDELVEKLSPLLQNSTSITESRGILSANMDYIQEIAKETIQLNGYHYPVQVSLESTYFPLKIYGDLSFPPGYYEALRVRIGEAKGKNWWCVMFPPLCFVDETYSVVDTDSKQKLKHLLTKEEYNTLIVKKKPIKVKFKVWNSLKKLL